MYTNGTEVFRRINYLGQMQAIDHSIEHNSMFDIVYLDYLNLVNTHA